MKSVDKDRQIIKLLLHAGADPVSFMDIVESKPDIKKVYEEFKKEKFRKDVSKEIETTIASMPTVLAGLITEYVVE